MRQSLHCILGTESSQSSWRPLREPHMLQSVNCNTTPTYACRHQNLSHRIIPWTYPKQCRHISFGRNLVRSAWTPTSPKRTFQWKFSSQPVRPFLLFPTCPHLTNLHDKALLPIKTSKTWHSSFFNSTCFRHSWIERIFFQNAQFRFLSLSTVLAGLVWRLYRTNKSESPVPDWSANTLFAHTLRFYTLHCPLCFIYFWNKYTSRTKETRIFLVPLIV